MPKKKFSVEQIVSTQAQSQEPTANVFTECRTMLAEAAVSETLGVVKSTFQNGGDGNSVWR